MPLARATIRDKLNLLLLVPLVATILLALPFVAARVDDARGASRALTAATNARLVADLLYSLQRERLGAIDHIVGETGHRHGLMLRDRAVVDDKRAELRTALRAEPTSRIEKALSGLDRLAKIRPMVVEGKLKPAQAYRRYTDLTEALLNSLRLDARLPGASAGRQLEMLDALLRATEASSRMGAALLVAAGDPARGRTLLVGATALQQLYADRFVRLAGRGQAAMMRAVEGGSSTKVMGELAEQVQGSEHQGGLDQAFIDRARDITDVQAVLRQIMVVRTVRAVEASAAASSRGAGIAAWTVGAATVLMFILVVALGVALSRSIAGPVRQLTRAASAVAELARTELARVSDSEEVDDRPPRLAAIAVRSGDEVGDLGNAFNQVQATAALLLERQIQTRRNVGLMFASVARRTQNLVGGQLSLIDELERNEEDPKLLAGLYRLDHLSMRLRRSAESLLVVSGVRDETRIAVPAQLATVLRSALAEIEEFRRVRLVSVCDVTVAPELVADLSLLLAELLENATSYSPPTTVVDVSADRTPEGCRVMIADHGIGMSPSQIAEENRRFVQRERLDIAPTTMLGLFVVGRIARRHGLSVALRATSGGGLTAVIDVPVGLLAAEVLQQVTEPAGGAEEVRGRVAAMPPAALLARAMTEEGSSGFGWFAKGETDDSAGAGGPRPDGGFQGPAEGEPAVTVGGGQTAGMSISRQQDDLVSATASPGGPFSDAPQSARLSGTGRLAPHPAPQSPLRGGELGTGPPRSGSDGQMTRGGLTRRVPGASLAASTQPRRRTDVPSSADPAAPVTRDPERERAALDSFSAALARAAATEFSQDSGHGDPDEGSTG